MRTKIKETLTVTLSCGNYTIDINPAVVTKLTDRGTYAIGIISDIGAFLPRLVQELWQIEGTV